MGYIVCNPTTKEWEAVPACGDPKLPLTYPYLAFDPAVSAHFHLVQFQVRDDEEFVSVHAYSSETKTWGGNQINEGWRQVTTFLIAHPHSRCPFINGFLHLLVLDQDQMKIAVVDVQGRARGMIPVPPGHQWMCYFGESQGQLHYMSQEILDDGEGKYNLSVWALEDYDAQEWVLKGTVSTYEVFGEDSCINCTAEPEFEVVDIHQDCNVVFLTHPLERSNMVAYDMDSKEVSIISTLDDGKELMGTARYVPCRFL
ncbi:hypothetical protein PVAP13_2NG077246 [Panicum virgatum]|uniref:F-box associated beta-propeller type 3 domain-containing protein n=2 Tax=Panicum virgatum TaxID=38727 RepID=A0A8T0V696_PANVG|nr:hypothetical protein PVAP13_2NG077246 [Panicum virgatum]